MKKLHVMTVVGTRPEIIRLSRVMARLDDTCDHVLVHTGQNYDYELNGIFFEEMGIRKPDRFLEVDTGSLGAVLGGAMFLGGAVLCALNCRATLHESRTRDLAHDRPLAVQPAE